MDKTIILFDVDGTLTKPRNKIENTMKEYLELLRTKRIIGIVGGSDLPKIREQVSDTVLNEFDYVFSENGLKAYKNGKLIGNQSIKEYLGEPKLKSLINFILRYIANLDIPIKRGTFIEFRTGMINISPIGRNCSQLEREEFEKYDKEHQIREKLVETLQNEFKNLELRYSIGGQISIDVFPKGWDKTFCLQFLDKYEIIHFFGDKTYLGGNDFELYNSERVIGHTVNSPEDTLQQCIELFK